MSGAKKVIIIGVVLAAGAIGGGVSEVLSAQPPTQGPDGEVEAFVRQALEDRLAAGDLPDGKLLGESKRLAVREELPRSGLKLGPGSLPRREGYEFYLLSQSAAQSTADKLSQHVYLIAVDQPSVSGSLATVWIGVELVVPKEPKTVVTCCCRKLAQFERKGGLWRFVKWLDLICR